MLLRHLANMALPERPPAELQQWPLPLTSVQGTLWRSHWTKDHSIYFGRGGEHRWDAPDRSYGICYAAESPDGAFAEGYFTDPGMLAWIKVGDNFTVPVSGTYLDMRAVSPVVVLRPLQLVDLRGDGILQIGADATLVSGPHEVSQRWGYALWTHPEKPDGIVWRSGVTHEVVAYALHERARDVLESDPHDALSAPRNRQLLSNITRRFRLAIIR